MAWRIQYTQDFFDSLKPFRRNKAVLREIEKKIERLGDGPLSLGSWLRGELHGMRSTRIASKYRLIYTPDFESQTVYLNWIDHREYIY